MNHSLDSPTTGTAPLGGRVPALHTADPSLERRTGHCQCGDIVYEILGAPDDPQLCSCRHCTRMSGGPATLWVGFRRETLKWIGTGGEPAWYATWPTLSRGFCPRCATHLISVAADSNMIMVNAFSLTDQSGTDPVGHSFREMAPPWMKVTLGLVPGSTATGEAHDEADTG
ncbi:GFA family protein [Streptomyces pratensis]|uniref:GFA family protein n=1 Tax=Streptomyces pratensis TaxID=1169025 RepID=UPI0019342A98|nr:GFA family protein [Streptomyces pratensis]